MRRLITLIPLAAAVVLLGAGCGGSPAGPGAAGPPRQDPNSAPADITREIACFRAHGLPDYPDPVYDPNDGRWHLANIRPDLTAQVRDACASVMPQATPASPVPTAQLDDLLGFAGCMRAHGVTGWPDPGSDGVFHTSINPKADPAARAAMPACERYLASSGGNIQIGPPNG